MDQNSASAVPRGGQSLGGKSVVIPEAPGVGATGKVPWSLVLVMDEDSPSELPAWGQAQAGPGLDQRNNRDHLQVTSSRILLSPQDSCMIPVEVERIPSKK